MVNTAAMLARDEAATKGMGVEVSAEGIRRFREWKQGELERAEVLDAAVGGLIEEAEGELVEDAVREGASKCLGPFLAEYRDRYGIGGGA